MGLSVVLAPACLSAVVTGAVLVVVRVTQAGILLLAERLHRGGGSGGGERGVLDDPASPVSSVV